MTKSKNSKRGIRKLIKWLLVLAAAVGLGMLAFRPQPTEVDIGDVTRGAMRVTVNDDGETRVRERYTVSAPLAGRLLRIGLEPGDAVKAGDVLASIDPVAPDLLDPRTRAKAKALVSAAEANIARAERQLSAAAINAGQLEKAYLRNKGLREKGNIAEATFEESERAHLAAGFVQAAAESAVEIARFELQQAEAALLRTSAPGDGEDAAEWDFEIRSPIDGVVLRVFGKSSRTLQAGTDLLEIGDPRDLEMRLDVLSQDAVKIEPGQKIIIEHWGGEGKLSGRVRRIEPSAYTKVSALGVDEQRVDVIADFESETAALGDGFRIEARVVIWEAGDVLQVPAGALFRSGDDWAVYRIEDERAKLVTIEVGHNSGDAAEVLSGLVLEDKVILHPGDHVTDGTRVTARP